MDDRAGLFRPGWIAKVLVYGLEGRTARGRRGGRQPSFLLAEPPRYNGGRPMRAVKDSLPAPSGEGEELEGPRTG
jgi:hypothetical protein